MIRPSLPPLWLASVKSGSLVLAFPSVKTQASCLNLAFICDSPSGGAWLHSKPVDPLQDFTEYVS